MKNCPYLFRQNAVYYFRFVFPLKLKDQFDARQIVLSIETKDFDVAKNTVIKLSYFLACFTSKMNKYCNKPLTGDVLEADMFNKRDAVLFSLKRFIFNNKYEQELGARDFLEKYLKIHFKKKKIGESAIRNILNMFDGNVPMSDAVYLYKTYCTQMDLDKRFGMSAIPCAYKTDFDKIMKEYTMLQHESDIHAVAQSMVKTSFDVPSDTYVIAEKYSLLGILRNSIPLINK